MQEDRNQIRILFGDPNGQMRSLYRQALAGAGFTNLREFASMQGFADEIAVTQPDLIFADLALPDGDVCEAVRALRHGKLGSNPFLPVIFTTWNSDQGTIRRAVDAGADDVLLKPVSIKTLVERIEVLAHARKPFVVTADYIGPDRRKAADRGESSIPLIEPPNVLKAKLKGEPIKLPELQRALAEANDKIQQQRLRQSAFRIAFVAQQIAPAYLEGRVNEVTEQFLDDLIASVEEIERRVKDSDFAHVSQICAPLLLTARQIAGSSRDLGKSEEGRKALELLSTLSSAVLTFFHPDKQANDLAAEVARAIDSYHLRIARREALAKKNGDVTAG